MQLKVHIEGFMNFHSVNIFISFSLCTNLNFFVNTLEQGDIHFSRFISLSLSSSLSLLLSLETH